MANDEFEFDSGLEIISPTIYVEAQVCNIIDTVQRKIDGKEISILFKGKWIKQGYYVSSEYVIPEQLVDTSSVDYKDEGAELYGYRQQGYNAVMHSHPFKGNSFHFSNADDKYINSHFPCSILCNIESEIVRATLLMTTDHANNRLRLEVDKKDINLYHPPVDVIGIDNIKEKPKVVHTNIDYSKYNYRTNTYDDKKQGEQHLLSAADNSIANGYLDNCSYEDDAAIRDGIEAQLAGMDEGTQKEIARQELLDYWGIVNE